MILRRPRATHLRSYLQFIAAALTLILCIDSAHAQKPGEFRFERIWPTLQQPWYFSEHYDLAVGEDDYVFVLSGRNNTVEKFDRYGRFLYRWGARGNEHGQFSTPTAIAIDRDSNVWIADTQNNRVQSFSDTGIFRLAIGARGSAAGQFNAPRGIAIDSLGNVYVSDALNNRIQKFTPEGTFISTFGTAGAGAGNLQSPIGISIGNGDRVYVADRFNDRISVFDSDGQFLFFWGETGSAPGEFQDPQGIVVASDGNVFVSDAVNNRIQRFTDSGLYLESWGEYGQSPGEFFSPRGLAKGRGDILLVADFFNDRVQTLDLDRGLFNQWGSANNRPSMFFGPLDITRSSEGILYVSDTYNNRVQAFGESGRFLFEFGGSGDGVGQFALPNGLDVDRAGMVYVCDSQNHRVQKFDASGTPIQAWGSLGLSLGQFANPVALAIGPDDEIFVSDGDIENNDRVQVFSSAGVFLRAWGAHGTGNGEFDRIRGLAVAPDGTLLVSDSGNSRIQRFMPDGTFITAWGSQGQGAGELDQAWGLSTDANGTVYVCDSNNHRIQMFTADGEYIDVLGKNGSAPGSLGFPTAIEIGTAGELFIVEEGNNRVQKMAHVVTSQDTRAIVVSAGGPFPGNQLWDTTQFCANFAMRALAHQGFGNEDIYYLSSDLDLDLDENGIPDDVDGDATNANLFQALTQWTKGADSLILYLVDHGGNDTFRMSGNEILVAPDLADWLDEADAGVSGTITIVYDACQSGSFVDELSGANRIVITSSGAEESAYFLSTGTISFSNFFWTHVFNGFNVADAFASAADAIGRTISFQTPQLRDPDRLADVTFLGSGTEIVGSPPTIVAASATQQQNDTGTFDLHADIADDDGVSRAWAIVRPPNFLLPSPDSPVQNLPLIELGPVGQDATRWEGNSGVFTQTGEYRLSFYARDSIGNTSLPVQHTIRVGDAPARRAILLGGGAGQDTSAESIEESLLTAYNALVSQGYRDDDIQFYAANTFSTGVDGLNILANLDYALGDWLSNDTQDLLFYAVGDGSAGALTMNGGQRLTADYLATAVRSAQERISGVLAVVLDSPRSGSFLPALAVPEKTQRIVIASAGADQDICLAPQRNISFSNYFWRRVLNGSNVSEAFTHAALAMRFAANGQGAELDDDGDGQYDTETDGLLAQNYSIGAGILLAGDDPIIGRVAEPQVLDGNVEAGIWAENVTTTGTIDRVFAIIQLPPASTRGKAASCGDRPVEVVELTYTGQRYEGGYNGFYFAGAYDVNIVAIDTEGGVSLPGRTEVFQMQSLEGPVEPDSFEVDNDPSSASNLVVDGRSQAHNFHRPGDEDWVVIVADAGQILTVRTERLGSSGDTYLELYEANAQTVRASNDDRGPQDPSSEIRYSVLRGGLLYARATHAGGLFGAGTEYEWRILREAGPTLSAAIAGTAIDSITKLPIPGLVARLTPGSSNTDDSPRESDTGSAGQFLFLQLGDGDYSLQVLGDANYEDSDLISVTVFAGSLGQYTIEMGAPDGGTGTALPACSAPKVGDGNIVGDALLVGAVLLFLIYWRKARGPGYPRVDATPIGRG